MQKLLKAFEKLLKAFEAVFKDVQQICERSFKGVSKTFMAFEQPSNCLLKALGISGLLQGAPGSGGDPPVIITERGGV